MEKLRFPALEERVEAMKQERRADGTLHIDPDPTQNAESVDQAPSEFGKGVRGGSP